MAELQVATAGALAANRMKESLTNFFVSKGNQLLPLESISIEGKRPEMAFTDGLNTTYLRVLEKHDLPERNGLLKVALDSVSFTSMANRVYVALPKTHAAVLDAAILREHGLGLVIYDARGVEEVLPASLFEHRPEAKPSMEIEQLKRRISTLERTVETLSSELTRVKSMKPLLAGPRTSEHSGPAAPQPSKPDFLPSFFEDNPWVDILAKRGREPEQVAG
jgi:hypothetical protein